MRPDVEAEDGVGVDHIQGACQEAVGSVVSTPWLKSGRGPSVYRLCIDSI